MLERESKSPDFVEALARGLDVIKGFDQPGRSLTLRDLSQRTGLARPTVRRMLLTLEELGYVRTANGLSSLTVRVLDLGMAYVSATNVWEIAQPYLERLSSDLHQSCSIAQLEGSDIVYVARAAVPKLVALSVTIGTRFPAFPTALGQVLLAALPADELESTLSIPSMSPVTPSWQPDLAEIVSSLDEVRAAGWAVTDQRLAPGTRAVAAPIRDSAGRVVAAVNINAHALETSVDTLTSDYLPMLLTAASQIGADWARWQRRPLSEVPGSDPAGS